MTSAQFEAGQLPYTTRDISRLVFGSFRHSRGGLRLQPRILEFIAWNYRERFSPGVVEASLPVCIDTIASYLGNLNNGHPFFKGLDLVEKEVTDVHRKLARLVINDGEDQATPPDAEEMLDQLTRVESDNIPHIPSNTAWGKHEQPGYYSSNLIRFGLLQRPTGQDEFNAFYAAAASQLWEYAKDPEIAIGVARPVFYRLRIISAAHISYNPDDASPLMHAVRAQASVM